MGCAAGVHHVVERIPGSDGGSSGHDEALYIGCQREVCRRVDDVVAAGRGLDDYVVGVVDIIGIVSVAADEGVGVARSPEQVIASTGVDGDAMGCAAGVHHVVERIPEADGRGTRHDEALYVGCQREIGGGVDDVVATRRRLDDGIVGVVDVIGVIAVAADERVSAQPAIQAVVALEAIQRVVSCAAAQNVVTGRAGSGDRGRSGDEVAFADRDGRG